MACGTTGGETDSGASASDDTTTAPGSDDGGPGSSGGDSSSSGADSAGTDGSASASASASGSASASATEADTHDTASDGGSSSDGGGPVCEAQDLGKFSFEITEGVLPDAAIVPCLVVESDTSVMLACEQTASGSLTISFNSSTMLPIALDEELELQVWPSNGADAAMHPVAIAIREPDGGPLRVAAAQSNYPNPIDGFAAPITVSLGDTTCAAQACPGEGEFVEESLTFGNDGGSITLQAGGGGMILPSDDTVTVTRARGSDCGDSDPWYAYVVAHP